MATWPNKKTIRKHHPANIEKKNEFDAKLEKIPPFSKNKKKYTEDFACHNRPDCHSAVRYL